jgi:hypothetical protein
VTIITFSSTPSLFTCRQISCLDTGGGEVRENQFKTIFNRSGFHRLAMLLNFITPAQASQDASTLFGLRSQIRVV